MARIDLNADIGEGAGTDAALLKLISSASIACGGHAGDDETMKSCLQIARENGVAIGAHPGFPDTENFGRERLDMPHEDIANEIVDQVTRLVRHGLNAGARVRYVKLHGALANMAAEDAKLAKTVFSAVHDTYPSLAVLAIDNSAQVAAAEALGMRVIREAYADRAYDRKGMLVPRTEAGAVIVKRRQLLARCLLLAKKGEILARDGRILQTSARSICIHGDTPGAVALAKDIRATLEDNDVEVRSEFDD